MEISSVKSSKYLFVVLALVLSMSHVDAQIKFLKRIGTENYEYDFEKNRVTKVLCYPRNQTIKTGDKPDTVYYSYYDKYVIITTNLSSSRDSVVLNSDGLVSTFYSNGILEKKISYDSLKQGVIRFIRATGVTSYYYDSIGGLKQMVSRYYPDTHTRPTIYTYKTSRERHYANHSQLPFPYSVYSFEGTVLDAYYSLYDFTDFLYQNDECFVLHNRFIRRKNSIKVITRDYYTPCRSFIPRIEDIKNFKKYMGKRVKKQKLEYW